MSDPAATPAAAPAAGGASKTSKLANAWGIAILVIVVVFMNLIGMLAGQLHSLLQVMKLNGGPILVILALIFLFRAKK